MAQFSQQEQNQMRRDAARRAREMQRNVYPSMRRASPYADLPPSPREEPAPPPPPPRQHNTVHSHPNSPQSKGIPLLGGLPQLNPGELLSKLDGDSMLIIALMVMLYKNGGQDGCDKKLLMALAYLLT